MSDSDTKYIDKIVDFAFGMNIANQMIQTMNKIIKDTSVPCPTVQSQNINEIYVVFEEKSLGPFSIDEIEEMIKSGKLTKTTLCWKKGCETWVVAENIPEINILFYKSSLTGKKEDKE